MIGVDIGGTNLLVGSIENNSVSHRIHQPITAKADFESVASQVCDAIASIQDGSIDTVGIAVAGSVDTTSGVVLRAENLDWDDVPLAQFVENRLQCKVVIENDVTASAWGEYRFGAGRDAESMFAVWIGTGIGGGLIFNGEIWRGPLGTAGEFGMCISEFDPSAAHRVLETFASRSGLQRTTGDPTLDTESIARAYESEHSEIYKVISTGALRVGTSLANVVTLLSLDTIVLGGGIVEALGAPYIQQIRTQFMLDVFPAHCQSCVFKQTQLGPDAGLLGVADLALRD
jgi:glucokinase